MQLLRPGTSLILSSRSVCLTPSVNLLQKMTRVRCVDNCSIGKEAMAEGKPPKIIHVYNKTGKATIGKYQILSNALWTIY